MSIINILIVLVFVLFFDTKKIRQNIFDFYNRFFGKVKIESPQQKLLKIGRKSISEYDTEYYKFIKFKNGIKTKYYGKLVGLSDYTEHKEFFKCKLCNKQINKDDYIWIYYSGSIIGYVRLICYNCCPDEYSIRKYLNKVGYKLETESYKQTESRVILNEILKLEQQKKDIDNKIIDMSKIIDKKYKKL